MQTEFPKTEGVLELNEIERDTATQTRLYIDSEKVEQYAEAMKEGAEFDPIITFYDGSRYYLADGWHRLHAADQAGKNTIKTIIYEGTKRDAIWYALNANTKHGKQLTNADKRRAVTIALEDSEWACLSDRAIARHCGCNDKTVGNIRRELTASAEIPQNSLASKNGTPFANDSLGSSTPSDYQEPPEEFDDEVDADLEEDASEEQAEEIDPILQDLAEPYKQVLSLLTKAKSILTELAEDPDNGGHLASKITRVTHNYEQLRWDIRQAMPTAWCKDGNCEGCPTCKGTTFLTLAQVQREKERIGG